MFNRDTFSGYHPVVNFLYFALVLLFSMTFMHPVCLALSLVSGGAYAAYLNRKAFRRKLFSLLPFIVLLALFNPLFSHAGSTILAYFPNGNPLTQESVVYGLAAAAMLLTVILWFSCYNAVMTSDKFVYLFGRIIPSLSLVLSMTLRFVPKFQAQIKVVSSAQKCVGRDASKGGVLKRAKKASTIFSIMLTWAFENAIETADSMKSRGYGLRGRTAFSVYRFDARDLAALIYLILCGAYITVGGCLGGLSWQYYPTTTGAFAGPFSVSLYLCYFALCVTPLILNIKEDIKWNALRSIA